MLRQYKLKNFNFKLVLFVVALSVLGYFAIGSARVSYQDRQMYGIIIGVILMIIISLVNYSYYYYVGWVIYGLNIVLLLMVLILGKEINGAKRWVNIGFQFQPSELAKILLILFFAQFIMRNKKTMNTLPTIIAAMLLLAGPILLIYLEPDLSTSIMIILLFCVMLFVGGLSYKVVFTFLGLAIPASVIFFSLLLREDDNFLKGYQTGRILAWLNPEKYADTTAYQQINSTIAISSGQLFGKGLNNNVISSVKNGNFISEPQTDFIYAIVGEELGFIGAAAVIVLILLIAIECFKIARYAKDDMGALICSGMAGLISIQAFMNIAVATGSMPNTGIPLPFVSYGLTSLVSLYMGIGVVLNVGLQTTKTH